ncbi:MAG: hypothetical protein M3Q34_02005 [bacterium]|nr:hypothetical protein [bacterium]
MQNKKSNIDGRVYVRAAKLVIFYNIILIVFLAICYIAKRINPRIVNFDTKSLFIIFTPYIILCFIIMWAYLNKIYATVIKSAPINIFLVHLYFVSTAVIFFLYLKYGTTTLLVLSVLILSAFGVYFARRASS